MPNQNTGRKMATIRISLAVMTVVLLLTAVACFSDDSYPAHYVNGIALDADTHEPIAGARVVIEKREGESLNIDYTDANGRFHILVGFYDVDPISQALNEYDYGVRGITATGYVAYTGGGPWMTIDEYNEDFGTFELAPVTE